MLVTFNGTQFIIRICNSGYIYIGMCIIQTTTTDTLREKRDILLFNNNSLSCRCFNRNEDSVNRTHSTYAAPFYHLNNTEIVVVILNGRSTESFSSWYSCSSHVARQGCHQIFRASGQFTTDFPFLRAGS